MLARALLVVVALILSACAGLPAANAPRHAVAELVSPDGRVFCAAFARSQRVVVTAAHCARAHEKFTIRFLDGTRTRAAAIEASGRTDVAFLTVVDTLPERLVLPVATAEDLKLGTTVIAIGHPFGFRWSVAVGAIVNEDVSLAEHVFNEAGRFLLAAISIAPGNSGGPLLLEDGRVAGVTCYVASGYALGLFLRVDEIETERRALGVEL